jgi:hypothetical protein
VLAALTGRGLILRLHRVAVIGPGTLDSLPHNGGVVTLPAMCRTTHRKSLLDIVMVAIVSALLVLAAAGQYPSISCSSRLEDCLATFHFRQCIIAKRLPRRIAMPRILFALGRAKLVLALALSVLHSARLRPPLKMNALALFTGGPTPKTTTSSIRPPAC